MYFDEDTYDELDEELARDKMSLKSRAQSKQKKKGKNNEFHTTKRQARARAKRRDEISVGNTRGRRKNFLSAFGARSSVSGFRGKSASSTPRKSGTKPQFRSRPGLR